MTLPRSKCPSANPVGFLCNREYDGSPNIARRLLYARSNNVKNLYSKDLLSHFGCVNAIEFSNGGEYLASGGDDRRVLLWNLEEGLHNATQPMAMRAQHISNIFCLSYDSKNTKIFSAGNDDQVIVHDTKTGDPLDYFLHEQPVYCLSVDPFNDNVFASACDDGRILIYDIREPSNPEPFELAVSSSAFHGVMFNPSESRLIATANAKDGAALWDTRKPKEILMRYGSAVSCMSVRWDSQGHKLLALRRRLPPVLYPLHSPSYLAQFDHPSYYNSCTMKSCCFAGENDQYVLSGSDDFNLYMWKVPDAESGTWVTNAHMILSGHRSIVNQVRFNPLNHLIASSGVEKLIKVWSPFPLPHSSASSDKQSEKDISKQRRVFSHEEYISLVLSSGQQFISHDYSHQSTKEDPRMMAFFDSLVQREIEGWSDSEHTSTSVSPLASDQQLSEDSSSCSSSENGDANESGQNKKAKQPSNNPIVELIARRRAQLVRLARNTGTKQESVSSHRKHACKRKRKRTVTSSSDSDNTTPSPSPSGRDKIKKLLTWKERNSSCAEENTSTPQKEASTSSSEPPDTVDTPDSGIGLSDQPASSKFKSRPHRNYRRRIQESDSD